MAESSADPDRIELSHVRRAFERAATTYDAAAGLQREIALRMLERLDFVKLRPATLLDAGSGTGHALKPLAARYPRARVIALDIAHAMLVKARDASPRRSGIRAPWMGIAGPASALPVCADLARLPLAPGSVDFIWSNLALQWCNDLPGVFAQLHQTMAINGLLMFSTFGPDTLRELRWVFAEIDGCTHVNRFVDMHDVGDMLVKAGFGDPVMDMEMITLTYERLDQALNDLKALGAHNMTQGRPRGLMGKTRWRRVREGYERFRHEGRLPATFEVIYGHAWKPPPRAAAGADAVVTWVGRRPRGQP